MKGELLNKLVVTLRMLFLFPSFCFSFGKVFARVQQTNLLKDFDHYQRTVVATQKACKCLIYPLT